MAAHNIPTDFEKCRLKQSSGPQVFSWALDSPIISLNNALFLVWLLDYKPSELTPPRVQVYC